MHSEEIEEMWEWVRQFRRTLLSWKQSGSRVDAQNAFHEWVMMGISNPQRPVARPLLLMEAPYWAAYYNGLVATSLQEFPEQTRLLLEWARRDRKAVYPIFAEDRSREYNISFLADVRRLQKMT